MRFEKRNAEEYVVDSEKIRKTGLYELVKKAIENQKPEEGGAVYSFGCVFDTMHYLAFSDESKRFRILHHGELSEDGTKEKISIVETKTKEKLTYNPFAKHGDTCPKLRGLIDALNGDKDFPHYAVIIDNLIYIDDEEAAFEYADRLTSKAANLVLRVADLASKCPLEMTTPEEKAEVAKEETEA